MTSTRWYHVAAIIAAIACLIAFIYAVRSILPPFLMAFAVAWLLDPILDRLQRRGCSRIIAVAGVYIIFLAAFIVALIFLVPAIGNQATQLVDELPDYARAFTAFASDFMGKHQSDLIRLELPTTLQEAFEKYGNQATNAVKKGIQYLGNYLVSNLGKVLWIILIPLVAFYLLNDLDRIRGKAVLFIPERHRQRTVEVLSRVGAVFSSYVRGLVIVCLLYGIATTVTLVALKLKYGIILGLLAGILYAVPYIGAILTTLLVFLVGLATYQHGLGQAAVAAVVMVVLNQVFDLFITPRILGKSVGLHPVLSLFALLAGGQLFGLVGMVLAVPVAASIQEVVFEFYPEMRPAPRARRPTSGPMSRFRGSRKRSKQKPG